MINRKNVKSVKQFGDFYDCSEGDLLNVFKLDGSSSLELLVDSKKSINFYKTCKMISEDKTHLNGNGNCGRKIIETCYLSQEYMDMRGHKLILTMNDQNDKKRELYNKYLQLLSERGLI